MGTKFFGQEHTLSSCIYGIRFKVLSFSNTMWIMAVELFVMAQSLLVTRILSVPFTNFIRKIYGCGMKTFYEHEVDKIPVITQAEVSRTLHWCQWITQN